jgi:hypothetical protein
MRASNRILPALGLGLALAFAAGAASADELGWVDHRQSQQWDRMQWQRAQGQISPYEWRRLVDNEAGIDRFQHDARRDDQLDLAERGRLASMLDRQSRAIYNLSHD